MKFLLNNEQPAPAAPVPVTTRIDDDGDICITIAGVEVAFIAHEDAELILYTLSPEEVEALRAIGVAISDTKLREWAVS
jgi:hypothetical protein